MMKNIYKLAPDQNFVTTLFHFIRSRFSGNFDKVKILLPSGILCTELQKEFISSLGICILPNIQSFADLTAESHEAFKVPSQSFGTLNHIEEKILLGEVISNYAGLNYNLLNSIKFAPQLSHLFYELESNGISLDDLNDIHELEQAEHWENIHKFIKYAYLEWEKILIKRKISSKARHELEMFNSEISRLKKNSDKSIVVAGIIPYNKQTSNFLKALVSLPNGHLILPPYSSLETKKFTSLDSNHPYFFINKFVNDVFDENYEGHEKTTKTILDQIKDISQDNLSPKSTIRSRTLNRFINLEISSDNSILDSSDFNNNTNSIKYIQFDDIFDEADFIAHECNRIILPEQKSDNRFLWKLASDRKVVGDLGAQDRSVLDVHEDMSTKSTHQSPAEVEFPKKSNQSPQTIAIVVPNLKNKKIYLESLNKYKIEYKDLIGDDLIENSAISLFIDFANFVCNDFNTKNFFKVLSNPYLFGKEFQKPKDQIANIDKSSDHLNLDNLSSDQKNAVDLKNLILSKNRFVSSLSDVKKLLISEDESDAQYKTGLKDWFISIYSLLDRIDSCNFSDILKIIVTRLESFKQDIWTQHEEWKISTTMVEIYSYGWDGKLSKPGDFVDLFKNFITGAKIFDHNKDNNQTQVTIAQAKDISLIKFDYLFLVDFSEGNYPPKKIENPWFNKQMQDKLSLYFSMRKVVNNIYDLYLNLHSDNVFLTRSRKQLNSSELLESNLIHRLNFADKNLIQNYTAIRACSSKIVDDKAKYQLSYEDSQKSYAYSLDFPDRISATDVETLIRSPYNFYAKKILKVKCLNDLDEYPNNAEFGSCFHKVAELFTLNYSFRHKNSFAAQKETLDSIISEVVQKSDIPQITKKIWSIKLNVISNDFIDFHNDRLKITKLVIPEQKGEIKLTINDKNINLVAIADRVEIEMDLLDNENGYCRILDYKTGTVPSRGEVLNGLSPQLIIGAIIMSEGGFDGIKREVKSIGYVKISSRSPYIEITEIPISQDEIQEHKLGLINLLEHYTKSGTYHIAQLNVKYDDYNHLARRSILRLEF